MHLDVPNLHIVLVRPEIPQNTGSIARLAAATRTRLHLVGPLGFSLEDRYLKRAGLDYWPLVDLQTYAGWDEFVAAHPNPPSKFFSAHAEKVELCLFDPHGRPEYFVYAFPGSVDEAATSDELRAHCRGKLAPYKIPAQIEFRDSLPKTLTGKILRRALKGV
jgi:acyl-CoA synthetase (AMP-forming)/AMP-acid ligase II